MELGSFISLLYSEALEDLESYGITGILYKSILHSLSSSYVIIYSRMQGLVYIF